MKKDVLFCFGLLSIAFSSCENDPSASDPNSLNAKSTAIFTLLDPVTSGFNYTNRVVENEDMNVMAYEYYYNGAGVAIGDLNNDGLPDIVMGGNLYGARLFLNKGNMKFEDITTSANVLTDGFQTGVTLADVNGDGFMDIYICRSFFNDTEARRNLLYINNQNSTFTERGKEFGLDDPGFSNQVNFFDYDNDGDLDMFLANHRADFMNVLYIIPEREWKAELERMRKEKGPQYDFFSTKLYRNNGNHTFTDVTMSSGLMSYDYTLSATVADVNMDNLPDIYVTCDYATKDHLYINKGNGKFVDEIETQMAHISKNSMGSDIADYNNDGLPDIVTTDMVSEDNYRQKQLRGFASYDIFQSIADYKLHYQVEGNCLQLNTGKGTFSEVANFAGVSYTDWSWAPLLADFNNDGHKDLYVTNGYARDITDMDYIKYTSPAIIKRSGGPRYVKRMELLNSVPSVPLKNYMYQNNGHLGFKNSADEWGLKETSFSNGAVYADLDMDGDLDLVVNNFNQPSFIYQNKSRQVYPENHYIAIRLQGETPNRYGVGAKVWIESGGKIQYQEMYTSRGYLSCVQSDLNFGLGKNVKNVKVTIEWPNGKIKVIENAQVDKLLLIRPSDGRVSATRPTTKRSAIFEEIKQVCTPAYAHQETGFVDFKTNGLLENAVSQMGPWVTAGDLNGDGLDDFYVGGNSALPGSVYLQSKNGKFNLAPQPIFAKHAHKKDGKSLIFDADGDGDNDLFVTSGFHEVNTRESFGSRLYLNDGKGNLTFSEKAIPFWATPSESAINGDFDGDGDEDIFVGGATLLGRFPVAGKSYLLLNTKGKFTISDNLPDKGELGIVQDIVIADLNNDKKPEIVIAGGWQPIRVLELTNGKWIDISAKWGLRNSNGLWYCLEQADIDGDGDMDIIAGNRGTNSPYKVSEGKPGVLSQSDLDGNGALEGLISYHYPDRLLHPKYSLDQVALQAPGIRSRFNTYKSYSNATTEMVVGQDKWAQAPKWYLKHAESVVLLNNGKGKLDMLPLNPEAQFFPIKDIFISDIDGDGLLDMMLVGNHYDTSPDMGREDAGRGLVLMGLGRGKFKALSAMASGFYLPYDSRQIFPLRGDKNKLLIGVANNQGPLVFFKKK